VLDELLHPFVSHNEERADEVTVVGKNLGVEIEDARGVPTPSPGCGLNVVW